MFNANFQVNQDVSRTEKEQPDALLSISEGMPVDEEDFVPISKDRIDLESVRVWWKLVKVPGHCVELRAFPQGGGTVSGYFNNPEKFEEAVARLNGKANIYSTINPVPEALLARGTNILRGNWKMVKEGLADKEVGNIETTGDSDIKTERLLVLDIDSIKPSGVSATPEELKNAETVAIAVQTTLDRRGIDSVRGMSGNDGYVVVRLPEREFDSEAVAQRKKLIDHLAEQHSSEFAEVDAKVANPSRIIKVLGTLAMKGEDSPDLDRPHRVSCFVEKRLPEEGDIYQAFETELNRESDKSGAKAPAVSVPENAVDRARAYVAKMEPGISGEDGHGTTFKVAITLAEGFALDEQDAWQILNEYNERCEPPWSEKELRHKLDDAMKRVDPGKKGWLLNKGRNNAVEESGKGGRPKIPLRQISGNIADSYRDPDGHLKLRYHRGQWFEYRSTHYVEVQREDLSNDVMKRVRGQDCDNPTRSLRDNVIANLKATDLAGLPSDKNPPFWLKEGYPDADGWLVCQNGLVNVWNLAQRLSGKPVDDADIFRKLSPELFAPLALPFEYNPEAGCPKWQQYLADVQPDPEGQNILQQIFGLSLVPVTRFNVFFTFFGPAGTGKSVCLYVLRELVGIQNVCSVPLARFTERFAPGRLTSSLLNIVGDLPTETGHGQSIAAVEGMLKDVADGGMIPVEYKNRDEYYAPAIARSIFAANSLPRISDRTDGIWDRMRVIPFEQRIRGTKNENPRLREELIEEELPGIFNWAAKGLAMLEGEVRFPEHPRGVEIKNKHRSECDPERIFMEEGYELGDPDDFILTRDLYRDYREWCGNNGYHAKSEGRFSGEVARIFGVERKRKTLAGTGKRTIYVGLRKRREVYVEEDTLDYSPSSLVTNCSSAA